MKRPHLLRALAEPPAYAELAAALAADGARLGWLELDVETIVAPSLEAAAALPALRAVALSANRTVAVKPLRGRPAIDDLLREHFLGCRLVLVRGDVEAPSLEPAGDGSWVVARGGARRERTTAELVADLRRPRLVDGS